MQNYGWLKTLLIFSILGPFVGSISATVVLFITNGSAYPFSATLISSYIIGLIPALLAGILFIYISRTEFAKNPTIFLPPASMGAIFGLITSLVFSIVTGLLVAASIVVIPGIFSGLICGAIAGLVFARPEE